LNHYTSITSGFIWNNIIIFILIIPIIITPHAYHDNFYLFLSEDGVKNFNGCNLVPQFDHLIQSRRPIGALFQCLNFQFVDTFSDLVFLRLGAFIMFLISLNLVVGLIQKDYQNWAFRHTLIFFISQTTYIGFLGTLDMGSYWYFLTFLLSLLAGIFVNYRILNNPMSFRQNPFFLIIVCTFLLIGFLNYPPWTFSFFIPIFIQLLSRRSRVYRSNLMVNIVIYSFIGFLSLFISSFFLNTELTASNNLYTLDLNISRIILFLWQNSFDLIFSFFSSNLVTSPYLEFYFYSFLFISVSLFLKQKFNKLSLMFLFLASSSFYLLALNPYFQLRIFAIPFMLMVLLLLTSSLESNKIIVGLLWILILINAISGLNSIWKRTLNSYVEINFFQNTLISAKDSGVKRLNLVVPTYLNKDYLGNVGFSDEIGRNSSNYVQNILPIFNSVNYREGQKIFSTLRFCQNEDQVCLIQSKKIDGLLVVTYIADNSHQNFNMLKNPDKSTSNIFLENLFN
jgi:hypothetical protein